MVLILCVCLVEKRTLNTMYLDMTFKIIACFFFLFKF